MLLKAIKASVEYLVCYLEFDALRLDELLLLDCEARLLEQFDALLLLQSDALARLCDLDCEALRLSELLLLVLIIKGSSLINIENAVFFYC